MKKAVPLATALLLALSLAACGSNDDQAGTQASGDSGMSSEQSDGGGMQNDTDGQMASASDSMSDSDDDAGQGTDQPVPTSAMAQLTGTQGNEGVSAVIKFSAKNNGVAYTARAKGLSAGKHGYHIHVNPDCSSPDGKSAGTHFNLRGSSENPPKDIQRITGNLGDLEADGDGSAKAEGVLADASLTGNKGLIGHSVIIHTEPNDPSQPPLGATGARVACGVIQATQ